jgi:hypothetical protein
MFYPPDLRRYRTAVRFLFATVAAASLTGCTGLDQTAPTANRYASFSIRAKNSTNGRAVARATAIIFEAYTAGVPNSALNRTDQCVYSQVDTSTAVVKGVKKAGNTATLGISGTTVPLPYDDIYFRYATPENVTFAYNRGDVVSASIPGAADVYPSATITVPLAEPIIPGTIRIPTGTEPMQFTWNGPNDSTSAVILSLRYANPATSPYANEQIYCSLNDDGVHQLPTTVLTAFLASPNSKRSLTLTRWRTREALPDSRTILHIASSVDTTLTFPP